MDRLLSEGSFNWGVLLNSKNKGGNIAFQRMKIITHEIKTHRISCIIIYLNSFSQTLLIKSDFPFLVALQTDDMPRQSSLCHCPSLQHDMNSLK